jgi:Tol biopolymer transport system component
MNFTPNRSWKDATKRLCAGAIIALLAGLVSAAVPGTARSGFPGTNGKIAFVSYRDGNAEIYVMEANGSGKTRLTNNSFDDTDPAWSADGSKIAFTRTAFGGSTDIYVMNADGTGQSNVTRSSDPFDRQPAWSPDGTKIAFTGSVGSLDAIFVMNADGSGRRQVSGANGQYPAWSPDGRRIAFQGGGTGGFFDIWVVDADGTFGSLTNLTNNLAGDYEPDWSPSGHEIAFVSSRGGTLDIYKMTTDGTTYGNGTNVLRLRAASLADTFPAWSPDGNQIAFQHEFVDNAGNVVADIYLMDTNGLIGPALTNDGLSYGPDWQPANTSRPVISCGSADGAWHGANVSIACTAHDDGSGLANPADAAFSLTTSVPDRTEDGNADTGTRQVCDRVGNCATAGPIGGNKIDRKAPTLSLPADQTVDAVSPAGATLRFSASAADGADPSPSVSCTPTSGSVFAIGTTTVACKATDHVGKTSNGSFTVTVRGAKEQLNRLIQKVIGASKLPPATKTQLVAKLQALVASFDPNKPAQRQAVCSALKLFTAAVHLLSAHGIPAAQAAEWIADANRIRTVLAC